MTDDELRKIVAQTSRTVAQVTKQIGEMNNKFGSFTEGMAMPSMTKILQTKFHAENVAERVKSRKGGRSMEIDVLAWSNGNRNEVYVVEVKSRANDEALDQLKQILADFPKFYPEHRTKQLYGILAAVEIPEDIAKKALKAGIYVARISDDVFQLKVPAGFRPHSFQVKAAA